MNRKQIELFIKEVYPEEPIELEYYRNSSSTAFAAYCNIVTKTIYLNKYFTSRKCYKEYDSVWMKCIILHELGHIVKGVCSGRSEGEFMAQKWGIEVAVSFGWGHVVQEMIEHLKDWGERDWNSRDVPTRRYIMAYKLSLKDEEFAKKHGLIV